MAELNSLAVVRRLDTPSRAEYLRLVYRVAQGLNAEDALSQSLLRNIGEMKIKPDPVDQNEQALGLYRKACADFHAGTKDIRIAY